MLVTADTSHNDRSWLKECALANIPYMLVTADTSQGEMLWLKDCASLNIKLISVTPETSHDPIGPCGPAGQLPTGDSWRHASTAPSSSVLSRGANAVVIPTTNTFGVRVMCLGR